MRTALFFLAATLACAFPFVGNAQSYGISGGLSYMKNYYLDPVPALMDTTALGGRLEFTWLAKGDPGVTAKYKSIGIECYVPSSDSVEVVLELVRGYPTYKQTILSRTPILFTGRLGFEIPQHWNDFLMLNIGFGAGVLLERDHFKLDSIGQHDFITNYGVYHKRYSTEVKKEFGQTNFYYTSFSPEVFAQAFYEFEHFSLFATYTFRYFVGKWALPQFHHSINIGIYYPLKTKS